MPNISRFRNSNISQETLKKLLHYSPASGEFTNREPRKRNKVGSQTGAKCSGGYLNTVLSGESYKLHRLAFLYMEGYFPEYQVDHINGVRDDNRWANLRHVTPGCNAQNRRMGSANTSGFIGVSLRANKVSWLASGSLHGTTISLGLYPTPLDAALARFTWEQRCPEWECSDIDTTFKAIKSAWGDFDPYGAENEKPDK